MDPRTELVAQHIRDVNDFPKPGIVFKDITPVLASPEALKAAVDLLVDHCRGLELDGVVAIESRGFLFGAPLALELGISLHIVRKPGKLPWKTDRVEYSLEYGTDSLEMHQDALVKGDRVLIIDDLLATGGTAGATVKLASKQGAEVVGCAFIIELEFLRGRDKVSPVPVYSVLSY